jgi:hypothetical protein
MVENERGRLSMLENILISRERKKPGKGKGGVYGK